MSNEVVKKSNASVSKAVPSIKDMLKGEGFKESIDSFFTDKRNRDRFVTVAVNALVKTPKLMQCTPASFFTALKQLASFGLEPDGRNAHMIPYGSVCTLIIDYKGLVTLALRCPRVSKVEAFEVCKNDTFRLVNGEVNHEVDDPWGDRGEVVGYYAVCQFEDGVKKYEVMSKKEIDAVRKRSRASNSGPWVTDYGEMAKKTVFKRLTKWLPITPELRDAIANDDKEYIDNRHAGRKMAQGVDLGDDIIEADVNENVSEEVVDTDAEQSSED